MADPGLRKGISKPHPLTDLVIADPKLEIEEAREAKKPLPPPPLAFLGSLGAILSAADPPTLRASAKNKSRKRVKERRRSWKSNWVRLRRKKKTKEIRQ